MFALGIALGLAAYLCYVATKCYFRVDEGHLGVVTTFGAAEFIASAAQEGKHLKTYGPGIHRKWPWQHAQMVSTMEQTLDLSGEESGPTALAEDGTVLRLDSIVRYAPHERSLYEYLFAIRAPIEHLTRLFTCLLRNEIANFTAPPETATQDTELLDFANHGGSYALIRRERQLLNARIEQFCRDRIGERYGVRLSGVDLTDILPPDELASALNAVMNAQSEIEARYFRAEGDCRQRLLASERGVPIAKARAAAVETEIRKLGEFLAELNTSGTLDRYVERRRAESLSESKMVYLKEQAS